MFKIEELFLSRKLWLACFILIGGEIYRVLRGKLISSCLVFGEERAQPAYMKHLNENSTKWFGGFRI